MIHHFESLRLKPYLCPAGVPTIGWGNTFYPNGKKVTLQDEPITRQQADEIFASALRMFEKDMMKWLKPAIAKGLQQHQFDALGSFAYNLGVPRLANSTLLKYVNLNPNDNRITAEFLKWNKSGGKVLQGLVRRRTLEAYLYTTGKLLLA